MIDSNLLAVIAILGIVTGLRSMLGLALLSWIAPPAPWIASIWARIILALAAVGELVADKLPKTPSRLAPGPLTGRVVIGAVIGGLLTNQVHAAVWLGAIVGAVGALAGSFGGNKIRGALGRKTGAKDLWFALGEDVLAIALAAFALLGPLSRPQAALYRLDCGVTGGGASGGAFGGSGSK